MRSSISRSGPSPSRSAWARFGSRSSSRRRARSAGRSPRRCRDAGFIPEIGTFLDQRAAHGNPARELGGQDERGDGPRRRPSFAVWGAAPQMYWAGQPAGFRCARRSASAASDAGHASGGGCASRGGRQSPARCPPSRSCPAPWCESRFLRRGVLPHRSGASRAPVPALSAAPPTHSQSSS